MTNWLDRILYNLLPGRCVLCLSPTKRSIDICIGCELDLPFSHYACWQCGLTLPESQELCGQCLVSPPPFSHCFAAFEYRPPMDKMIAQFKNSQQLAFGRVLSKILARQYIKHHLRYPDVWVPVPLHSERLKIRGFNQALEIAQVIAAETATPVIGRACRRIKATDEQKLLSRHARKHNISGAFVCETDFQNAHVGIIDDVVTTTETVAELSRVLVKQGAADVQVVCIARTPHQ
jgi:ComF family protein